MDGEVPKAYRIRIEKVNDADPHRNMILRVTDRQLLAKTGGIVQGMSGSPILQNGRLVGAVTHVLVNDPTRGYGILLRPCSARPALLKNRRCCAAIKLICKKLSHFDFLCQNLPI